ncbi:N-acetylglucosamine-6-sulfatase-like isoform X2 [Bacillus rossius redtenbacheri]|uniref:N-acetylglucosamine-6-sulfatase-like isoform X2 n=1 Tax=Bacillus rossius redtenbacheri TaxID=93214 RepID=UPI002FDCB010
MAVLMSTKTATFIYTRAGVNTAVMRTFPKQEKSKMTPMRKTLQLIGNMGATFTNAFVTTPVCCPSRSSILTGMYAHNHGTFNNSVEGGCSSLNWQNTHEKRSYAVPVKTAGYKTFYAGKYLNQYGREAVGGTAHVPLGWDWWIGLVGNSRYYNYTLSLNGTAKTLTSEYLTNVIKNYSLEFLRSIHSPDVNFLMVLAPPAPHAPFTPEPKYRNHFSSVKVPKTPNFNTSDNKDKHWLLRMSPAPLPDSMSSHLDNIYSSRWETLLSVDDMVEAVIEQLDTVGLLNDTYIIFTSDHGFHVGQFSLPWDKRQPYDFDIQIPLMIRGPGIKRKTMINHPVLNIDLAPTILTMAGLEPPAYMDGSSFLPLMLKKMKTDIERRVFLVEYKGEGDDSTLDSSCPLPHDNTLSECVADALCKCQDSRNNTYSCLRSLSNASSHLFCAFEDDENFLESYDLLLDPFQLHNLAPDMDNGTINTYMSTIQNLKNCTGNVCNRYNT